GYGQLDDGLVEHYGPPGAARMILSHRENPSLWRMSTPLTERCGRNLIRHKAPQIGDIAICDRSVTWVMCRKQNTPYRQADAREGGMRDMQNHPKSMRKGPSRKAARTLRPPGCD